MKETPMIKQYLDFKRQHPNDIVLFRMGDFFETFGEDAEITSKILNITLTRRNKNSDSTLLAGFPHHALNQYLPKLVKGGYCVAIIEQIENPKFSKGLVKRALVKKVSPGTLEEDENSYTRNKYLVSLKKTKNLLGISIIDIMTGDLKVYDCEYSKKNLNKILGSYPPSEILLYEKDKEFFDIATYPFKILEKFDFLETIKNFYKINTIESINLKTSLPSLDAVAMTLKYILDTQQIKPGHISKPIFLNLDGTMYLDTSTIRNLDLVFNTATNSQEGTLISILSESKTNMGRRELYNWILNPLVNKEEICKRLNIVEYFFKKSELLNEIRTTLSRINDIERIVGRIGLIRANARDYRILEESLLMSKKLYNLLKEFNTKHPILSQEIFLEKKEDSLYNLIKKIEEVITEEPPLNITEGGIIKQGFNEKVDELRNISGNSKMWVKQFEEKEKKRTGINNLKIGFNRVFGYYIEVTNSHRDKVPEDYSAQQTLVNSERYFTEELKKTEKEILNAEEKLSEIEFEIFENFRKESLKYIKNLKKISREISQLDVLQGFAFSAITNNYIKPEIYQMGSENRTIEIKEARHPVIEKFSEENFVSNNIKMNDKKKMINILTGPNMSGKSTYIRQIALIVLMAQIGSFIPAKEGNISLVDRIYTRVGASDDLIRGRSTFMVEMNEAANIINNATKNSLVILDEIGRGTSTYDGVSIAWALAEYLMKRINARTIFATHYHELLVFSESNPSFVTNLHVQVEEDEEQEEVIFLRKIKEGGTNRSYGIYVAKLAGLPPELIERAKEILKTFEKGKKIEVPKEKEFEKELKQLNIFENLLIDDIKSLDINNMSPIEALNKIEEWKKNIT